MKLATYNRSEKLLLLTVFLFMLSACSTYKQGSTGQEQGAPIYSVDSEVPAPESSASKSSPADNSLISRAEASAASGDFEQALALLERAQRIEPTNADIYLALARTYLAKGDLHLAQTTAERGLLFCSSDRQCNQLQALTK